MDACKPILTPVQERLKLVKGGSGDLVDATNFKRLIESLRYLTATRPDIVYGVGIAGDIEKRKSTLGYVFYLGSAAFSWSSKKQQVVAF
ncbi:hypothetical protein K2173_024018 [Erythroxylum novogranatense]|uniref:Retrovirus-related Pol polyprotein from transposon TNT 1-94 n=1 Tax=Erythroxylum novogranatense TaxID=1862640 RepID=A0AAV8TQ72_9ROSI|nr:hypothetical protein K2173_024018 [Erythroxylum novogranatense]